MAEGQDKRTGQGLGNTLKHLENAIKEIGRHTHESHELIAKLDKSVTDLQTHNTELREKTLQRARRPWKQFVTLRSFLRLANLVALLIGLLASVYDLRTRLSMSVGDRVDPDNPLSNIFSISNDGALNIYDVEIECGLGEAFGGPTPKPIPDWKTFKSKYKSHLSKLEPVTPVLRSGQKVSTTDLCVFGDMQMQYADLAMIVTYKEPWLIKGERHFRLITVKTREGKLIWMQQPF